MGQSNSAGTTGMSRLLLPCLRPAFMPSPDNGARYAAFDPLQKSTTISSQIVGAAHSHHRDLYLRLARHRRLRVESWAAATGQQCSVGPSACDVAAQSRSLYEYFVRLQEGKNGHKIHGRRRKIRIAIRVRSGSSVAMKNST